MNKVLGALPNAVIDLSSESKAVELTYLSIDAGDETPVLFQTSYLKLLRLTEVQTGG